MAKYKIDGKVYETSRELSPEELQQFMSQLGLLEARGEQSMKSAPMVGSMIGGAAGGMVGGVPGALAGSAAGGAAGEALRQQITGEPTDVGAMGKEALMGAAGEGVGQVISRAAPAVVSAAKAGLGLEKEAPRQAFSLAERQAAQQTAQGLGTSIPASRMGGNFSQLLEGFSQAGLGQGRFAAADKQIGAALTREANNIVENATTNALADVQVGDAVRAALETADTTFKQTVAPVYKKIEDLGGTVPVFTPSIKENAKTLLNEALKMSTSRSSFVGLDEGSIKLLKDFADTNTTLTFSQANELRSKLLTMQRDMGTKYEANTNVDRYLNDAISALNKSMDKAAEGLSPELRALYNGVNKEYKNVMSNLYDKTVKQLLNKNPERLGESMARSGNITEINKMRQALAEAKRQGVDIKPIEENLLQGYLKDITKGLDDSVDSFLVLNDKMKDRKFKRTYDMMMQINPTAKKNIDKLMNVAKIAGKTNEPTILQGKGGVGGLINVFTVVGGGAAAAAGGAAAAAPAVVGLVTAQALAAKAMTSPSVTNILLVAERIAQKQGIQKALDFLQKSKPLSRWIGQELARSELEPKMQ